MGAKMPGKMMVFIAGFILTTLAVVLVFKAFIGPILAVTGLVILFASTLKRHD